MTNWKFGLFEFAIPFDSSTSPFEEHREVGSRGKFTGPKDFRIQNQKLPIPQASIKKAAISAPDPFRPLPLGRGLGPTPWTA